MTGSQCTIRGEYGARRRIVPDGSVDGELREGAADFAAGQPRCRSRAGG